MNAKKNICIDNFFEATSGPIGDGDISTVTDWFQCTSLSGMPWHQAWGSGCLPKHSRLIPRAPHTWSWTAIGSWPRLCNTMTYSQALGRLFRGLWPRAESSTARGGLFVFLFFFRIFLFLFLFFFSSCSFEQWPWGSPTVMAAAGP